MSLEALQAELTEINAAISAVLQGAQEYRIKDRSLKRADLGLLYRERRILQKQIAEYNGYNTQVARFIQ